MNDNEGGGKDDGGDNEGDCVMKVMKVIMIVM